MPEISKLQALTTPDTTDLLLIVDVNGGNGGKPRSKKITVENLFSNFELINGNDGLSAYQIAVNNGFVGSESDWLASLQGEDGSNANIAPGAWQTPALQNSWQTFDVTPKYRKLADGRLEVKGTVKLGTIPVLPSTIFTLPIGYRPIEVQRAVSLSQFNAENRTVRISISTDGTVAFAGITNSTTSNSSILSLPLYFTCCLD